MPACIGERVIEREWRDREGRVWWVSVCASESSRLGHRSHTVPCMVSFRHPSHQGGSSDLIHSTVREQETTLGELTDGELERLLSLARRAI